MSQGCHHPYYSQPAAGLAVETMCRQSESIHYMVALCGLPV